MKKFRLWLKYRNHITRDGTPWSATGRFWDFVEVEERIAARKQGRRS